MERLKEVLLWNIILFIVVFFCIKNLDLLLLDLEDKAKDVSE